MPAPFAASLLVTIDGARIPEAVALLLIGAEVETNQNAADTFTLRFRDPDRVVVEALGARMHSAVSIGVETSEAPAPVELLTGEITAFEAELDATGSVTVLRGHDCSHRLMSRCGTETYRAMSYSDIVRKVCVRAGLRAGHIVPTGGVVDFIAQGNVDDWSFLRRLANEVGFVVKVCGQQVDFHPPVAKTSQPPVLRAGADLLSLRTLVRAETPRTAEVRSYDLIGKKTVSASAPVPMHSGESAVGAVTGAADPAAIRRTGAYYPDTSLADQTAKHVAAQASEGVARLEAVVRGNPLLRAEGWIAVEGLGAPFERQYRLTRVQHVIEPNAGYVTRVWVNSRSDPDRPKTTTAPSGVVIGVVADIKDPMDLGRVRVTLPWLDSAYVSDWAPCVYPGAGKSRGIYFVPEINDQVLVAFEYGDLNRAYVLGGLHSTDDRPPDPRVVDRAAGNVAQRAIISRDGHSLRFAERSSRSAPDIALTTGDNTMQLAMDHNGSAISITSDGTVVVNARRGVQIKSPTGEVAISGQKISLQARAGITIDSDADVSMNARTNLNLAGSVTNMTGRAMAQIDGGQACAIKGTLVRIN